MESYIKDMYAICYCYKNYNHYIDVAVSDHAYVYGDDAIQSETDEIFNDFCRKYGYEIPTFPAFESTDDAKTIKEFLNNPKHVSFDYPSYNFSLDDVLDMFDADDPYAYLSGNSYLFNDLFGRILNDLATGMSRYDGIDDNACAVASEYYNESSRNFSCRFYAVKSTHMRDEYGDDIYGVYGFKISLSHSTDYAFEPIVCWVDIDNEDVGVEEDWNDNDTFVFNNII